MSRLNKLVLFLFVAFLATFAEAETKDRLSEINSLVEHESNRLTQLQDNTTKLQSEYHKVEKELEDLRSRERNIGNELQRVIDERKKLDKEITLLQHKHLALSQASADRLRALYMTKGNNRFDVSLLTLEAGSVQKIAYYSDVVNKYDKSIIARLAATARELDDKKIQLNGLVKSRDKIKSELTAERKKIAAKARRQELMITQLQRQQTEVAGSLTKLRAQALRLETVVASLTVERDPEYYSSQTKSVRTKRPSVSFEGAGLESLKGSLVMPVDNGRIVKRFGRQAVTGFKDIVFSKGVEFALKRPSSVKAIADARVMHAGRMPGYGTILILDHGKRSYSLYGQLGEVLVRKGDIIDAGQKIATTMDSIDDDKGNFYFEIRKNGKPIDPKGVFGRSFKVQ